MLLGVAKIVSKKLLISWPC